MIFFKKRLTRSEKAILKQFGEFYQKACMLLENENEIQYDAHHLDLQKAKLDGACEVLTLTIEDVNGYNFNIYDKAKHLVFRI